MGIDLGILVKRFFLPLHAFDIFLYQLGGNFFIPAGLLFLKNSSCFIDQLTIQNAKLVLSCLVPRPFPFIKHLADSPITLGFHEIGVLSHCFKNLALFVARLGCVLDAANAMRNVAASSRKRVKYLCKLAVGQKMIKSAHP